MDFIYFLSVLEDFKAKTKLESEEYNSHLQVCKVLTITTHLESELDTTIISLLGFFSFHRGDELKRKE